MRPPLAVPALLLVLLWSGPGLAAPRSIADCESIKSDLAYNQCLASFGPAAGGRPARAQSDSATATEADEAQAERKARRASRSFQRSRAGRRSMSFGIVSGETRAERRARRR
jgi:hypothetical protein